MRARILGSGAGGGVPQWNCGCPNCTACRSGSDAVEPRTQDSVAVAGEGGSIVLLNASPDVRAQIAGTPELLPRGLRHTPISAVVLTNGDLDHCLGLLSLRESQPFVVYATHEVQAGLRERNALFRTLERSSRHVRWRVLELGRPTEIMGGDGRSTGLELTAFEVAGKVPRHLEGVVSPAAGDNVGLLVRDAEAVLAYATAVAKLDGLAGQVSGAACLLLDGTFYSSDELARLGIEGPRAEEMAHLPIGGEAGSLAGLAGLSVRRRIYTHLNNTNPVLARGSAERAAVEGAGWEIARDGLEITL